MYVGRAEFLTLGKTRAERRHPNHLGRCCSRPCRFGLGTAPWGAGALETEEPWARWFDVPGTYVYLCQLREFDGMLGSNTITDWASTWFRCRRTGRESCEAGDVGVWMRLAALGVFAPGGEFEDPCSICCSIPRHCCW